MSNFMKLAMIGVLGMAACGAEEEPGPGTPLLDPPAQGTGLQLSMQVPIASGEEAEFCQYVVLPGDGRLEVGRFQHRYSSGSHHLIVYQTGLAAEQVTDELFPCAGASFDELGVTGIAYAAQVADGELAYPDGVALPLTAGDVMLLNTHYLNVTDGDLDAEVRVNLEFAEQPASQEAGTLFFYDYAIVVPPNQRSTARMRCQLPQDVNLLFAMSHMHRRGVGYAAVLEGGPEPLELYTTDSWEDVEPRKFAPELPVAAGQVVDFRCEYQGEPDRTIIEGPSADANEMCMFIASYYPRQDFAVESCNAPGSGPVFEGELTCGEALGCMTSTEDPIVAEQCMLDTCSGSSAAMAALNGCTFQNCFQACGDGGDDCQACVVSACGAQLGACSAATCE